MSRHDFKFSRTSENAGAYGEFKFVPLRWVQRQLGRGHGGIYYCQIKYLKGQRLGRLATLRPDGTLQNNPVVFTFVAETDTFEIGDLNMGDSQKYKNVVANGQVAFVVDDLDSVEPWKPRMIEVRGTAASVPNEDSRKSTILIHPNRVISYGIEE